ncbi:hypothetical protein [Microcella sp.]|uniref:hypothetical protein n=1 Tax=Microcella sp. TaxID=1913979 RepID=UPI00255F2D54|nr:hypothetical protein [Microcella sp.]MBX9471408.1 hypothetical protein [Microcella sp.]MBX9473098.1 hypothetical protein [Microcella sp.]
MTRRARRSVALVTIALSASLLAGCSALPFFGSQECVSWVTFDGDQQMLAESARLIVVGEVIEQSGMADLLGGDARLYRFDVQEASDERYVGQQIEIASRADGCAADPYGSGDQLDTDERIAVFLSTDEQWNGLATLTPFDGVLPADELEPGLVPGLPPVDPA